MKAGSSLMSMLLLFMSMLLLADTNLLRSSRSFGKSHPHQVTNVDNELGSTPGDVAPKQFLIISSPAEKKIVWTTIKNSVASEGRAFALVDSGLSEPKGMAFDHKRGHLYVADSGAKKIFRYTVLVDVSSASPRLSTSGVRLTVVQGHPVESVTVDDHGNLFYAAPDTNNINKIPRNVMQRLAKGEFRPDSLQIVSEKTLEAEQATKAALAKQRANQSNATELVDTPSVQARIYSMYEAKLNPHVSSPTAIWADGSDLYWTNTKDGKKAGTVVKGKINPKSITSENGPAAFPAEALTNVSEGAYSVCKSHKIVFFTQKGTRPNTGLVSGLLLGSNVLVDFVQSIQKPKGLVWDKDQTVYVADEGDGAVWSFPAGRVMKDVPLTKAVGMKGAHGLVILSTTDPAFAKNSVTQNDDDDDDTGADATGQGASEAPVSLLQNSDNFRSSALGAQCLCMLAALVGVVALLA